MEGVLYSAIIHSLTPLKCARKNTRSSQEFAKRPIVQHTFAKSIPQKLNAICHDEERDYVTISNSISLDRTDAWLIEILFFFKEKAKLLNSALK